MTERSEYEDGAKSLREGREPYLKLALATLAGPFCWVLHFGLIYVLEGLFCIRESPPVPLITGTIVVATLVFGSACIWLMLKSGYWLGKAGAAQVSSRDFLVYVTRMLAGLSLLAIAWSGMGVIFLSACSAMY